MHPPVCIVWIGLQRTRQDPETRKDYQRTGARTVTDAQQLTEILLPIVARLLNGIGRDASYPDCQAATPCS
jgi:hypothetical protein